MTNRQLFALYGVTLIVVFGLACAWEFAFEDIVNGFLFPHELPDPRTVAVAVYCRWLFLFPHELPDPRTDRWEYVITLTAFAAIALIVPGAALSTILKKQREAEAAYRRSEGILRAFIDHAPALVALKHADGRYLLMNKEYTNQLALDPSETEGKSASNVFPSELADEFAAQERKAIETGTDVWGGARF